jgi:NCAIR mutase (PurE)-related protein
MENEKLRQILTDLASQRMDIDQLWSLRDFPYADLGYARLDFHRSLRKGSSEVIFCEHKTPEQVVSIIERMAQAHTRVMGTRVSPEMAAAIQIMLPEVQYDPVSRLITLQSDQPPPPTGEETYTAVLTGGTADIPVAEEAAQTLEFLGHSEACL